jgi:GH25 family lysozyme M1 (1,4-beta-N-acetylmuramidase)
MADPRPLGIDVSSNQGAINAGAIAAHEPRVLFCGIRASISWGFKDSLFPTYWEELGRIGIHRSAYHVVWPKQDALRQMDNFYAAAPEQGQLPRVLDFEVTGDGNSDPEPASPTQQAEALRACSDIILDRDGSRPIIYSRKSLVDEWLVDWTEELLNEHWWWLAQYMLNRVDEHPGPPSLPKRVHEDRVLIHQTADKKPGFGVESKALDRDRWQMGDEQSLQEFVGIQMAAPLPPLEKRVDAIEAFLVQEHGFEPPG